MPKPLISVGQLIDSSWDVYRTRFFELLSISGWLILPAIFYAIALAFYPAASNLALANALTTTEIFGVILFAGTTFLIAPITTFWVYIALVVATNKHLSGKNIYPTKELKAVKPLFIPAAITSAMVGLMTLFAIVIGFGPAIILNLIGALTGISLLVGLASILLILGIFVTLFLSIRWLVFYIFAPLITILDGTKGKLALYASHKLLKRNVLPVAIRIIVPKLVFLIFGVFLMSIFSYFVALLIDASAGLNLDLQLRVVTMTETIVPILISVLINPLVIISDILLFRDLKR